MRWRALRRIALIAPLAAFASNCGTAAPRQAQVAADSVESSSTTATSNGPTTAANSSIISASAPISDCSATLESLFRVESIVKGQILDVGAPFEMLDPFSGSPAIARKVTIQVDSQVIDPSNGGGALSFVHIEADLRAQAGAATQTEPVSTLDLTSVPLNRELNLLSRTMPNDHSGGRLLVAVFDTTTADLQVYGSCQSVLSANASRIAKSLGYSNSARLIEGWLKARAAGNDDQFVQAEVNPVPIDSADLWNASSPLLRSLRPADVPKDVASTLDVRAVQVNVQGLPTGDVVVLRTASGVSISVATSAMTGIVPVFFVAGKDTEIQYAIAAPDAIDKATLVGSVVISQLPDLGGFKLSGSDPTNFVTEVLAPTDVAKLLVSSVQDLSKLKTSLLAPPSQ